MAISGKELAKLLNVSEAAISMALNNKPGVSTKTRKAIIEAAKAHGYDFTRIEENFSSGEAYLLVYMKNGAIIGDTPFFSALFKGLSFSSQEHHIKLTTLYVSSIEELNKQLYLISKNSQAGVLLLATEMSKEELADVKVLSTPIVVLDAMYDELPFNYVLMNNNQGAYLATNYLIHLFHAQPGYLKSSYSIANFNQRADGFYHAIRGAGYSSSKTIVHTLSPSSDGAYSDMKKILEEGDDLAKCYFADNDLIAMGAMRALKEAGKRVPRDIAIIGFDNIPLCACIDPSLSSVNVPKEYMAKIGIERLISLMQRHDEMPVTIYVDTSLVLRDSTLS
jgi:LacI family transcriptional regulator